MPKNPEKYVGDVTNIIYRSGWEKRAMIRFDEHPDVVKWGSEEIIIPYISPVDGRPHRYFPDFMVISKSGDKFIRTMVEIKPHAQCEPPKPQKRQTKRLVEAVQTYAVNQAKWTAARKWCADRDTQFVVFTEYELGIKKRPNGR